MEPAIDAIDRAVETLGLGDDALSLEALRARVLNVHQAPASVQEVCDLVARLRGVLTSGHADADESELLVAAVALLARDSQAKQVAALELGAFWLVRALPQAHTGDRATRLTLAAQLLLIQDPEAARAVSAASGFTEELVAELETSTASVLTLVLQALLVLTSASAEAQAQCALCSAVLPLARISSDGSDVDSELAGGVLWNMANNPALGPWLEFDDAKILDQVLPALQGHQWPDSVSTALATSVLTRAATNSASHGDSVVSLVLELRGLEQEPPSGPYVTLFALEDLLALVRECDAPTARLAADNGLVSICVARILAPTERADVKRAASLVLMEVLARHVFLHAVLLETLTLDQLVEQLAFGNLAVLFVLKPLVDDDEETCAAAAAAGTVTALARALRDGNSEYKSLAVHVIDQLLALDDAVREEAVNGNMVELLVHFLACRGELEAETVLRPIQRLVQSTNGSRRAARDALLRAGGAQVLVATLFTTRDVDALATRTVMLAVVEDDTVAQGALVEAGAFEVVVDVLVGRQHSIACPTAARLLGWLGPSVESRLAADKRVLRHMLWMLKYGSSDDVDGATFALSGLAENGEAAQTAMGEVGAIEALLQALEAGPKQEETRSVVIALANAVDSHSENQLRAMQANGFETLAGIVRHGGGTQNPTWPTARIEVVKVLGLLIKDNNEAKTLALERHGAVAFVIDELRHEEDDAVQVQLLLVLCYLVGKHAAAQRVLLETSALALFMQLKLFDPKLKDDAVQLTMFLVSVMMNHDVARTSDALWEAGIVEAWLTNLRDFTDEDVLTNVLNVVSCLTCDTARVKTLGELFPMEHALGLVATTSGALHGNVVSTICVVAAYNSAVRRVTVDRGVLAVIVAALRESEPSGDLFLSMLGCLTTLVDDPYVKRIAAEELGVVELLSSLHPSLCSSARDTAALILAVICADQSEAMTSGVLQIWMELLRSDSTTDDTKGGVVSSLATLVDGNAEHQTACANAGALPLVVALVTKDVTTSADSILLRREAARAVANLVKDNRHVQCLAVEGEVVEQLRDFCDQRGGMHDEQTMAFVKAALAQLLDSQTGGAAAWYIHSTKVETTAEDPSTMVGAAGA